MKINIHNVKTSDDLRLQGIEYEPETKDGCVLFVHGMSGNFIENYVGQVLGEELSKNDIGFIYSHNRGYNHINDIATSQIENGSYKTKRIGAMYEIFTESLLDIEAWVKKCDDLGYKKIILMGHSLGAPKIIYYFSQKKPNNITGVILTSPGDMVGLITKAEYQPNFQELYDEAENNVQSGEPRKLLSSQVWDWYTLSSQTFLSLFEKHGAVDNLPLHEKDGDFSQLASINVPILGIMAEHDDIAINTLQDDLKLIEEKATGATSFTGKFVSNTGHTYDAQEKQLADVVIDWVKNL